MAQIGILVNAFSGSDLRRITSNATAVGDSEKIGKVLRMLHAMEAFGVESVVLMPDNFYLNQEIIRRYRMQRPNSSLKLELLEFFPTDQPRDSEIALKMMEEQGARCIITMGGDGTCRLAAKVGVTCPVITISTGTNNAYPEFSEGTNAGIAAAYLLRHPDFAIPKDKQIEIEINESKYDVAVVDAIVTNIPTVGSRVVSEISSIQDVIICRAAPAMIGFSSIVGALSPCSDEDDFGWQMKLGGEKKARIPLASGRIETIEYSELNQLQIDTSYEICPAYAGTLALDGERTIPFRAEDRIRFRITRNGLRRAKIERVLHQAVQDKFFEGTGEPNDG